MKRHLQHGWAARVVVPAVFVLSASIAQAQTTRSIAMSVTPNPARAGAASTFTCTATGPWRTSLTSARMTLYDASGATVLSGVTMTRSGLTATYGYTLSSAAAAGTWRFSCTLADGASTLTTSFSFAVQRQSSHASITSYAGPSTCIGCHTTAGRDMLATIHMKWTGPTPEVTNAGGKELGKAVGGINTFCTYAMSSQAACFNCHVRSDGNAGHAPVEGDVDCLMCHSDAYQRKLREDTANPITVTNVLGQTKTYYPGFRESDGDYVFEPNFASMPTGTTMVGLAQTVHRPTRKSCLRCHAKAGGGDWTKRGDMGANTESPTADQDVHMASTRGNLSCTACHKATLHKMGGRGIDLRETEAPRPTCTSCHAAAPHASSDINRHAQGRVACQVCHIRTFGKGGATEMARDWTRPVWNATFCNGQGGFVGEETRQSNVKPEYVWWDNTSYVYNVGETITMDPTGVYHMAKANGKAFDGKSKVVPVKRHFSVMAKTDTGKIVPPVISTMFMTGDWNKAVQDGMAEQGLTGGYTLVNVDAELLITHGVDPKTSAPACAQCHATSGNTPDGTLMLSFGQLGYHNWPVKVQNCTLCHSAKSSSFTSMHGSHRTRVRSCANCHGGTPTGLVKPTSDLCNDCHSSKTWQGSSSHKKHVTRYDCTKCHKF